MSDQLPRGPRILVVMEDGATFTVEAVARDLTQWDITRGQKKWPPTQEAPFLWMTFLAWTHLTRTGEVARMTFDEFVDAAHTVISAPDDPDDDGEGTDVDPTNRGAGPG